MRVTPEPSIGKLPAYLPAALAPVAVLPSGCRNSAPKAGTRRNPTESNGNGFPSDYRDFLAKTACALGFLKSPLPLSILVSSTALV